MKKETTLRNTSKVDVVDYPIMEAVLNESGDPRINPDTQQPVGTGETLTWDILAGETKVFPAYVAKYLKSIYGFLDEVETVQTIEPTVEEVKEEVLESNQEVSETVCKVCGYKAANIRGIGMHIAARHPELLTR